MTGFLTSLLLFFALLACGSLAPAQEASELRIKPEKGEDLNEPHKITASWNMEMGGKDFDEGKDQGAAAYLYFDTKFNWEMTPWLRARANPEVDIYSRRVQERFDSDDYADGIALAEAYLSLHTVGDLAEFRGGAINQGFLNDDMLVYDRRSFPGFQQLLNFEFEHHKIILSAQQVVPTSYSLNDEREDREPLPVFNTQSIEFSGRELQLLDWRLNLGHYSWTNLPNKIAYQSSLTGNSVLGDAPDNAFRYQFDGYFGGLEVCACMQDSPLQVVAEFQRIANKRAASGFGDAQMVGIGPRYHLGEYELSLRYRHYFIERDATVSAYNRSFLGNSNRVGDNVRVGVEFLRRHFAIFGEYDNALTIRQDPNQFTFTAFRLGVETNYAPF
jgi:hypothetical protein